ncbi:MAG TPA: nucleotidyltransferase family protein [Bacteroidales bacterium]|jgi:molybdenum cofactor cytidylyltransferase|nr:nucleotidyltransferase family protein [Bacteroidales bacterium]
MDLRSEIQAIVLAAGESRRMGRMKMLLPFRGTTMLEHVIDNIFSAGLENITVVLGHKKEELAGLVDKKGVNYCVNNNYTEGMLSSVICGVNSLTGHYRFLMVFQGDQPLISPGTIGKMIDEAEETTKSILIPVHEGKRGHPLMVSRQLAGKIGFLDPAIGLRALTNENPEQILEVSVNDPGILRDFDTYDEYIREINQTM